MTDGLSVGLLGPMEVTAGGRQVVLTTGQLRALLAVLALSAGVPVSIERLADALWEEDLPANARRSVQTYVTRLRALLGPTAIRTTPSGYALDVLPDQVDALRFERELHAASRAPDGAAERTLLHRALRLWRGEPFQGLQSRWLQESEAPRLVERYLVAIERRVDLDLAAGQTAELVPELNRLIARNPLRESLWVRLLRVLEQQGRQAEALIRYESVRARLAEELGVDPGPELSQIHRELLLGGLPEVGTSDHPFPVPGPRQLPAAVTGFVGRRTDLAALDRALAGLNAGRPGPVVVSGAAGVGKTTLVLHWAHLRRDRFRDGQLYLNLRGFDPSGQAVDPTCALRSILESLGIPPHRVPAAVDDRTALYRSLLAGRRILVVLDNARDVAQVRPLLPSAGGLAVVTSRSDLSGLLSGENAQPVVLDLMPAADARALLAARLGADRVHAEPDAVNAVVVACAGLPLALAIVAARAKLRPAFPLAVMATELQAATGALDAFDSADPDSDLSAVFSWSMRALSPEAAALFRALGLHPGPDVTVPAAASLGGVTPHRAQALLAELAHTNLVTEHRPGRFRSHDLLRAYAAHLADATQPAADRDAAMDRLFDHYLHTGHHAAHLLSPVDAPANPGEAPTNVAVEYVADHRAALQWFIAEHDVLLAVLNFSVAQGRDRYTWQLAWTLLTYLERRGHWNNKVTAGNAAVAAAGRLGDTAGEAAAHRGLASGHLELGQVGEARLHAERALELAGAANDDLGLADARFALLCIYEREGRYREALEQATAAHELYGRAGHPAGQARALNGAGWCYIQLGDYPQALPMCEKALAQLEIVDDPMGQGAASDSIGVVNHQLGHYREAMAWYQQAIELLREAGNRYSESEVLIHLGQTQLALGDHDGATRTLTSAVDILDELGHYAAADARGRVATLLAPSRG
ncbi:MAG TPA: BTAD domain-containing putative transcriptional regulator [Pilimelia sp.]|nr:BTAD domain-containing putative transcriptional regulator [Pilimelia sp.]